jgi:hypothetical protein
MAGTIQLPKLVKPPSTKPGCVLGAQILLGFELSGVFRDGFETLPTHARYLDGIALLLMIITVAFLVTPESYHQIVEIGADTFGPRCRARETVKKPPAAFRRRVMWAPSHSQPRRSARDTASRILFASGAAAHRGMRMNLSSILIGRRLANQEGEARKITAIEGVPAMGLDGLGSSAYGPEAALTIFISLGAEGLHLIRPIMAAILVLLALLYLSYRQTRSAHSRSSKHWRQAARHLPRGFPWPLCMSHHCWDRPRDRH